ncbi:hypothetical protein HDK90DRAFT_356754 [Phyllosticta capitalensis]|uniref:Uncharacterized protein n=1 Tax=Phyllosticta capitalensis TaxID=121624 RepID=A0ABR1YHQ8_9PEZI
MEHFHRSHSTPIHRLHFTFRCRDWHIKPPAVLAPPTTYVVISLSCSLLVTTHQDNRTDSWHGIRGAVVSSVCWVVLNNVARTTRLSNDRAGMGDGHLVSRRFWHLCATFAVVRWPLCLVVDECTRYLVLVPVPLPVVVVVLVLRLGGGISSCHDRPCQPLRRETPSAFTPHTPIT